MLNIALEGKLLVGACVVGDRRERRAGDQQRARRRRRHAGMLAAPCSGCSWPGSASATRSTRSSPATVINIGALGITNFLFLRVLVQNTELNTPPTIEAIELPSCPTSRSSARSCSRDAVRVLHASLMVVVLTYMLFRTRWGLRLRASGEKPAAAGTVGINVIAIRYRAMLIAGLLCGLAGSYLSLSTAGSFQMDMSAGKGFIALAAVIFGAWHPIGAFGAALVFGFADATQALLSILGVDVPPQLLNSVPYIVTIIVVAGVVGRVRGPAAAGQPYEQG